MVYTTTKKYLEEGYYPWIQANCPWFTDHGKRHIDSVIHTASTLLSSSHAQLTCLDLFLLLMSIIWHDVGMVSTRSHHAKEARKFINKVRELCLSDQSLYRLVTLITRAHSGKEGWDFLEAAEDVAACTHKTCTVYPRSLAAVLRFADEASETRLRISPHVLDQVPQPQQLYWQYANSITASRPDPARQRIIISVELQRDSAGTRYPCPNDPLVQEHADTAGQISLIEYIICRLEKMNNERSYCHSYLTRYADIRNIEVRLRVCNDTDCETFTVELGDDGLSGSAYPNIRLVSRFFEEYPKLHPDNLRGDTADA